MATERRARQDRNAVSIHDRRLYAKTRAFGRFGMRIFEPVAMPEPHWHGHIEANFLRHGGMSYVFDGQPVDIAPDRLVVFWAGVPHQLTEIRRTGQKPMLSNVYLPLDVFLNMPHIARLQVSLLQGAMVALPPALCTSDCVERWYADYRSRDLERGEVMKMEMNALFRRVCLDRLDYLVAPTNEHDPGNRLASVHVRQVVEMVRFVLDNLDSDLRNDTVARVTGASTNHALGLFTKTMNVSLGRFIIRMRLLRARALLIESDLAIASIAHDCGFNSMSQFYYHFVSAYGVTPNRIRTGHLSQAAG
jgi:AraC-like DNA-binding protein